MSHRKAENYEEYEDELVELHEGIVNDDINMLKQVLQSGLDVNQKFSEGVDQQHIDMTPLSLAAALNKVDAVKLLLSHNANVDDTFAALKTTALMTSSFHGHSEIVKLLIKKRANVNAVDDQGSTALGYAFGGTKNFEVINQLLRAGIDVNLKNMLGMNALLLVAGYSNDLLVKMILDAGADANSVNDFNHSALHIVVVGKWSQVRGITGFGKMTSANYGLQRRNLDITLKEWARSHRHLLKGGREDERLLESIGQFMMEIASRYVEPEYKPDGEDDQETMKKRVEAVWSYRQDKLTETKTKKSGGVIDNLLSCGGKRGKKPKPGESKTRPLNIVDQRPNVPNDSEKEIIEISEKCAKILKYILDAGCETDKVEKTFGMTALDMAILFGDAESTAVLASAGGDPFHLLKMFSLTELQDAIVSTNKKRVKEILASDPHIDVNQKFSSFNMTGRQEIKKDLKTDGLTPMAVAAQLSDVEILDIIKMLQKQGGDINAVGSSGSSPLAEACRVGNLKMVEFLVAQGASVEQPSPCYDNATPVTIAASNRHYQIVDFLTQQKQAKLDKKLSNGKTALILASENDDKMMVEKILGSDLISNYADRSGFTYEMAKEFQRPDKNYTRIQRLIAEETSHFKEDIKNKNTQPNIIRPNAGHDTHADNTRVSGPINANQTRPKYDFKPAIKHQEESEDEDEEEEEEEEEDEEQTPPQKQPQQKREIIPSQQKQKIQQESESEESEEEEDDRRGKKVVKQVVTTRQVTKVIPQESSEEEESEEEESEEEEEIEIPKNISHKTGPPPSSNKVLSAAAVAQASKQQSTNQPRPPQTRPPQQPYKPQRPASESEESEEESEEEEVPVKQMNGSASKGRNVANAQKFQPVQTKQSQPQPPPPASESEEEEEDEDEEEEEDDDDERTYTVQQKVILPSQKIESQYASHAATEKQSAPIKKLIETHRMSPINLPPPLPATSPPQDYDEDDDDDDDDIEYDYDEEGYEEQFPTKVTNLTVSPNKTSKSVTSKTVQGKNSRTVVTKTIVTSTKTSRQKVPMPIDSDDDDVDEEYDDDDNPAHGTETDI